MPLENDNLLEKWDDGSNNDSEIESIVASPLRGEDGGPVWGQLDTIWVSSALLMWLLLAMIIPTSEASLNCNSQTADMLTCGLLAASSCVGDASPWHVLGDHWEHLPCCWRRDFRACLVVAWRADSTRSGEPCSSAVDFAERRLTRGVTTQAFSVATETFGNGIFGVGNWLLKDRHCTLTT